jgi:gas vesicle protein
MGDDNKLSFFFLGLGLGVAAGILFAPKSGQETRELLKNKASESGDYLVRQSGALKETAGDLLERGKTVLNKQKDTLSEAVEAGKQAYRDTVSAASDRHVGVEGV